MTSITTFDTSQVQIGLYLPTMVVCYFPINTHPIVDYPFRNLLCAKVYCIYIRIYVFLQNALVGQEHWPNCKAVLKYLGDLKDKLYPWS